MEVVTEKEKVNGKVAKKEGKAAPTIADLYEVQKACDRLLQTTPSMKGKYIRIFHQNANIIHPILVNSSAIQEEIMKKYIEMDEATGEFKRVQDPAPQAVEGQPAPVAMPNPAAEFAYKSEDDHQKCDAELKALWESAPEVKLYRLTKDEFDQLQINPSVNKQIGLIIEFLVY